MKERSSKMVEEAVQRMRMLQIYDEPGDSVIEHFKTDGKVFVSKPAGPIGVLCTLTSAEQKLVDDFEKEYECLVYHVIRSITEIGVMYSLLYVSQREEEWEFDRQDLQLYENKAYPCAYVINVGNAEEHAETLECDIAEFGSIGIRQGFGGLIRTE